MGIVELNNNVATIFANLYFYGNAANEILCKQIADDINAQWTIENGSVNINGKNYFFIMKVAGFYAPKLRQTDVNENTDPLNNFFRIEEYAEGNISFVDGINSNTGYFKLDNLLHNSTTAAHEFGHTLGLVHPDLIDIRGYGIPGIMYPRGTICDAEYQYDANAQPLAPGGTMNPHHRKVSQKDIDDLHLEKLRFNANGKAVIGEFTSEWHYAHVQQ